MKVLIAIEDEQTGEKLNAFLRQNNWLKNAKVKLISVIPSSALDVPLAPMPVFSEATFEALNDNAKQTLEVVKNRLQEESGVVAECQVTLGDPTFVILDVVKDWKPNILITGSHCRMGLDHFISGSISEELAAKAPCSVLVLRN